MFSAVAAWGRPLACNPLLKSLKFSISGPFQHTQSALSAFVLGYLLQECRLSGGEASGERHGYSGPGLRVPFEQEFQIWTKKAENMRLSEGLCCFHASKVAQDRHLAEELIFGNLPQLVHRESRTS